LPTVSAGAVGINLTQANWVFIMVPFLNPALEAQSIGRVHRLEQRRSVEIIELIVADTIETRLHSVLAKKLGTNPSSFVDSTVIKGGDKGCRSFAEDDHYDCKDESDDYKKSAAADEPQEVEPLIGCIQADKSIVAAEEFDF
jgi:superfamily II DNA or RNA helicase